MATVAAGDNSIELSMEDTETEKIDTYTHKKDIPPLVKESGLDVNLPEQEEKIEDIGLKVEKVVEEKEEKDIKSDKLVKDFW